MILPPCKRPQEAQFAHPLSWETKWRNRRTYRLKSSKRPTTLNISAQRRTRYWVLRWKANVVHSSPLLCLKFIAVYLPKLYIFFFLVARHLALLNWTQVLSVNQIKEARKGFQLHSRAQTHASAEWLKIRTPEVVKSCVKSREPEIKSAENICF